MVWVAAGLLLAVGALGASTCATAWSWSRTAATDAPLRWPRGAQISWRADSSSLSATAAAAAASWTRLPCDGAGLPWHLQRPGSVNSQAIASGTALTSTQAPAQVQLMEPPQPWPVSQAVFAYTAVIHNAGSGEISTFRIRLNGVSQQFCQVAADCAGAQMHLQTVLSHEWGHVWGLGHSDNREALMAADRFPGEVVPGPLADDRAGLCALYAADMAAERAAAADGRRGPFGGCSVHGSGGFGVAAISPKSWFYVVLAVLMSLVWVRRRRSGAAPLVSLVSWLSTASLGVVALMVLGGTLIPAEAEAYILARSASGAHQRWYVAEVPYSMERDGLVKQGLDDVDLMAVAQASFATWAAVQCPLCHDPRGVACAPVPCAANPLGVSFRFLGVRPEQPIVGCADGSSPNADNPGPDTPGCDPAPNGSQIAFVDQDWPYGTTVIATTIVVANKQTGEIADADIRFNSEDKVFCLKGTACPLGEYDLQNTLTHEVGHLLGLDHSLDGDATMFGGAPPGEVQKRDLLDDDVAGVCAAYRQAWAAAGCPTSQAEPAGCCAVKPSGRGLPGGLVLSGLTLLACLLIGARRRRRPALPSPGRLC